MIGTRIETRGKAMNNDIEFLESAWEFNNTVDEQVTEKFGYTSCGTCTNKKNYELIDRCTGIYCTPNNHKACKNYNYKYKRYDNNG